MKGNKIILSAWSAGLVFCVLQIIWGPQGILRDQELKAFQTQISARLVVLQDQNQALARKYEALRTSETAVKLQARQLGWFQAGDVPVRVLAGPQFGELPTETHWNLVEPPSEDNNLDAFFRAAWFLLFISFYLIFFLFERLSNASDRIKGSLSGGSPVPDLQPHGSSDLTRNLDSKEVLASSYSSTQALAIWQTHVALRDDASSKTPGARS